VQNVIVRQTHGVTINTDMNKEQIMADNSPRNVKLLGVINSWGASCGKNGWQWISEDFFPRQCFEARAIIVRSTPEKLPFLMNLEYGDAGKEVERLQTALIALGYDIPAISSGKVSKGHYGVQTQNAVFVFQQENCYLNLIERYIFRGKYWGKKSRDAMNRIRS